MSLNDGLGGQKPMALILGAKRGMAGAISTRLSAKYQVVHVSRTSPDCAGDLRRSDFRKRVAEQFSPELVISSFGNWEDNHSLVSALETFLIPNVDLFEQFERKGCMKKFVLVSSAGAQFTSQPGFSKAELHYACSKRAVSDVFQQLQLWGRCRSRVLIYQPGFVATDFAGIKQRMVKPEDRDIIQRAKIKPLSPDEVGQALVDLIENPLWGDMTLTTFNHSGDEVRG